MSQTKQLDLTAIEELAERARDTLPEPFRSLAREVGLSCEEEASRDLLDDLGMDDPLDLTGLYEGVPLTEKSVMDPAPEPDVIRLFRRAILTEWRERGDISLSDLVAHVYVHELAHHLGWTDDDIAAIDRWWE